MLSTVPSRTKRLPLSRNSSIARLRLSMLSQHDRRLLLPLVLFRLFLDPCNHSHYGLGGKLFRPEDLNCGLQLLSRSQQHLL